MTIDDAPRVVVVVPCHQEEGYLDRLLSAMVPQILTVPGWSLVLVDDASTDATAAIVDGAAAGAPMVTALHGRFGSPGAARSAGVAAALDFRGTGQTERPDWIITTDADVELTQTWAADWAACLAEVDQDESVGAVNGQERQDHLLTDLPVARRAMAALGHVVGTCEAAVGTTNLNGVNHAVRATAYDTCGPYRQPMGTGPHGPIALAGEDWDLGVRLRLAGYRVADSPAVVLDRGRRLLADPHAYASGEAYEGAFERVSSDDATSDVTEEQAVHFLGPSADRLVMQFLLKIVLADPRVLATASGLSPATLQRMSAWIERWPAPLFTDDRNGFIYGRLRRFTDAVVADVRADLGIDRPSILDHFGAV